MHKQRIRYMDNLKVMLTCLVVAHHAGQAYGPSGGVWVVKEGDALPWLRFFFYVNASYMMGLYFFISGYFMVASLEKKTTGRFINDRLKRLGIPLLFFTFLVFLPFNYVLSGGEGNVFLFLADTYLYVPPLATGHLWFVASLLLYTFLYLAIRRMVRPAPARRFIFRPYYIPVYIFFLGLVTSFVRSYYPIDQWRTWLIPVEVAHLPQYLSLFMLGTLFKQFDWLGQLKLRYGFLVMIITAAIPVLPGIELLDTTWIAAFEESGLCVGLSIILLVIFRNYFNQESTIGLSFSQNSYGIYLFHLLIVLALQQLLVKWPAATVFKFSLVVVLGVFISFMLSVLLRKIPLVRRII